MENPSFSGDYIDNRTAASASVAEVPYHQSRTGNVPFGPGASSSRNQNVPISQDLHVPSNSGLNNPANASYINPGIAPPPYTFLDSGVPANKPAPPPYSPEDHVQQHITIVTLEEPPSPCSNHCSWNCWRKTHLALAMIAVIVALVKIMMLVFSN